MQKWWSFTEGVALGCAALVALYVTLTASSGPVRILLTVFACCPQNMARLDAGLQLENRHFKTATSAQGYPKSFTQSEATYGYAAGIYGQSDAEQIRL